MRFALEGRQCGTYHKDNTLVNSNKLQKNSNFAVNIKIYKIEFTNEHFKNILYDINYSVFWFTAFGNVQE